MHVTILADPVDNQNAGVHFYTKNLVEHLLKVDKKNRYSLIHLRENYFFKNTDHHIIPYKKRLGYDSYRKFFLIPRLVKKLNPDIVLEPAHMGPFRIPKTIKRATIIHDLTPILFPHFHIRKSARNHRLFLPRIIKNADLIITPSENTKLDIQNHYHPNAHIQRVHAGIKPIQQCPLKRYPFPYLLYLGTLEPRKNLPLLITAFKELKQEHQIPHKLILAGKIGWKSEQTIHAAQQHPDILLRGYVDKEEKAALYQNAAIFIYPSIYEGFGLPPLEAMAHGTPVICSKGGSLQEILANKCLTFYSHDKFTLKKHILSILNDKKLAQTLRNAGPKHAQTFTWENTARETIKALQKVVSS